MLCDVTSSILPQYIIRINTDKAWLESEEVLVHDLIIHTIITYKLLRVNQSFLNKECLSSACNLQIHEHLYSLAIVTVVTFSQGIALDTKSGDHYTVLGSRLMIYYLQSHLLSLRCAFAYAVVCMGNRDY